MEISETYDPEYIGAEEYPVKRLFPDNKDVKYLVSPSVLIFESEYSKYFTFISSRHSGEPYIDSNGRNWHDYPNCGIMGLDYLKSRSYKENFYGQYYAHTLVEHNAGGYLPELAKIGMLSLYGGDRRMDITRENMTDVITFLKKYLSFNELFTPSDQIENYGLEGWERIKEGWMEETGKPIVLDVYDFKDIEDAEKTYKRYQENLARDRERPSLMRRSRTVKRRRRR